MHKARLVCFFGVVASLWGQQDPAPNMHQAPAAPVTRNAKSTPADLAVPLCPQRYDDGPLTNGIAPLSDGTITRPKVTHMVNPTFSDEARNQKRKGRISHFEADLSFVVNTDGEPESVCLMESAGYGLDAKAAEAVQQYRFAPATKDGKPVAVRTHAQVDFNLNFGIF
jgi:TonB family protein